MFHKTIILGFAFVAVLVLGLFIGYALKPQVKVLAYDPDSCSIGSAGFWNGLNPLISEFEDSDSEITASLKQMKKIKPLVKAGPFEILWNSTNGDFVIYDTAYEQAIAMRITDGEETNLSFNGMSGKACLDLTYNQGSNRLIHSMFFFVNEEDSSGLPQISYFDSNGDGRLDKMVDREAGARYGLEGLRWVEYEKIHPR